MVKNAPKWIPAWRKNIEENAGLVSSLPLRFFEVHPPLECEAEYAALQALFSQNPTALELIREDYRSPIKIIVGATSEAALQPLKQAYPGAQLRPAGFAEPRFVRSLAEQPIFFSVEQLHSLPFVHVRPGQEGQLMNRLCAALTGPSWIQLVWAVYDWTWYAEAAAWMIEDWMLKAKQPPPTLKADKINVPTPVGSFPFPIVRVERSAEPNPLEASTLFQEGRRLASMYREKAQSTPLILHVRGLLVKGYDWSMLEAALASVELELDCLTAIPVEDPRALRWMRLRALPDPSFFLRLHAEGGFLREWGRGRELVPALCITPRELPAFIHLPSDPSLPVEYARTPMMPRAPRVEEEEGLELWR